MKSRRSEARALAPTLPDVHAGEPASEPESAPEPAVPLCPRCAPGACAWCDDVRVHLTQQVEQALALGAKCGSSASNASLAAEQLSAAAQGVLALAAMRG